ncbi:hypothetical protein KC345_g8341 [Hortaea werneckii]|nr:hypothetical protein KC345_g8341 [Hortaea werneckii]
MTWKSLICTLAVIALISTPFHNIRASAAIQLYDEVWYGNQADLSKLDLTHESDLLQTLSFSSRTKWPVKLPTAFKPPDLLEYGKDPGLNIRKLQQAGYTGAGVNIAYIDQPLLTTHKEFAGLNLHYMTVRDKELQGGSMHGPSVLSLLAGKDIGVAPGASVYFVGHPAWLADQTTHAEAIRRIIAENKKLPAASKIKIIGFSDTVDLREKNPEAFRTAISEAKDNGIFVLDVSTFNLVPLTVSPYADKNASSSYKVAHWMEDIEAENSQSNLFYVPSSSRTTALGQSGDNQEYAYWTNAGLSWTVPYIEGVIALGLQADPALDMETAIRFLQESGTPFRKGKMINPEGFIWMVEEHKELDLNNGRDYYYMLYNANAVTAQDLAAIQSYARKFNGIDIILKDVASMPAAADIYQWLGKDKTSRKGQLKGVQIFGSSSEVPAFDVRFKIQMENNAVDDSGRFFSDFFYSTQGTDATILKNDFSIYKAFNEKQQVDFTPDWKVMRLPLAKGEIAPFIAKYSDFTVDASDPDRLPVVNFSNPIFAQKDHSDDMGYFLRERLDKEFRLLKSNQYTLYGNHKGYYPVTTASGEFTQNNLQAENRKGIAEIFINSHGQQNNIDQAIFASAAPQSEQRISLVNNTNINSVLSANAYALTTWTCSNAWNLSTNNLIHTALAGGKAINAFGASTIISNNGVNNKAKLQAMKANNFYYFFYEFYRNLSLGKTRSDSFFEAQKAYSSEILKHTDLLGEGNYQFNLLNVLSYHNLGLIEYRKPAAAVPEKTAPSAANTSVAVPGKEANKPANTTMDPTTTPANTPGELTLFNSVQSPDLTISSLSYKSSKQELIFTLQYESGQVRDVSFFDPPNGNGILLRWTAGMKKGKNSLVFKVPVQKLKALETDELTMRFGFSENNFISFKTDQLDY